MRDRPGGDCWGIAGDGGAGGGCQPDDSARVERDAGAGGLRGTVRADGRVGAKVVRAGGVPTPRPAADLTSEVKLGQTAVAARRDDALRPEQRSGRALASGGAGEDLVASGPARPGTPTSGRGELWGWREPSPPRMSLRVRCALGSMPRLAGRA